MNVEIIRSKRKTLSIHVSPEGKIIARAPLRMPKREIEAFIISKSDWIARQIVLVHEASKLPSLSRSDLDDLKKKAHQIIPARAFHYAEIMGLSYGKISIRTQKTRWGSCSAKGNLNFNALLLLAPPEIMDYVIVHELAHLRHMNHSSRFWAEVAKYMPDYKLRARWFKENGVKLMGRLP